MFSREHWQIKLAYAGFGALLLFMGMLLSPVTAQRDRFGEIECSKLRVVDADGNTRVVLTTDEHGGGCLCLWQGQEISGGAPYH